MEWISVKTKLPNKGVYCLWVNEYGDMSVDAILINDKLPPHLYNTHWMPLPDKPNNINVLITWGFSLYLLLTTIIQFVTNNSNLVVILLWGYVILLNSWMLIKYNKKKQR